MGAPHDWDWASPSITSGPSLPPGQPSTGPHIGYGGGQQTQVTAPPVQTGTPNFGPHGSGGANQPPSTTIDNTSEIISDAGWDALTNAGNIDNNIGTTTLADGTISVPELTTSSTKPVEPFINVYNEEVDLTNISDDIWDLAVQASTSPGYELSHEGQGLMNEGIMPGSAEWVTHFGLPQIVGTSTSGIPVTSGGYTDEYGQEIPSDIIMTGLGQTLLDQYDNPTGSYQEMEDDYWAMVQASQDPSGGPGREDYGDYYGDRRQAKMDLLTALQSGAPSREMEQSGFFDTLVDPYAEAQSKALESGIFSGLMPGYTGEGMKRLLRSYGSGLQAPRYANVAKGGIVGLLGV